MSAFLEILRFEIRYQLRQPLFWVSTVIFALLSFGAVTTDSVTIGGAIGSVNRNAPYVIMQILLVMSAIGIFTTTAFVANAIHRDFEYETHSLFFSAPISKTQYMAGRFLGAFLCAFGVFFGVAAAIAIGGFMPWLDPERVGPFMLSPYLWALAVLVLPNLFFAGAIFFSVAAITRSMLWTYVGVGVFFVGYSVASSFLVDLDNQSIASLMDPFGFAAFTLVTKYWTVFQRNASEALPLTGALLWNRVLWTVIAFGVLGFTWSRFRMIALVERGRKAKRASKEAVDTEGAKPATHIPHTTRAFGSATSFRQYFRQTWVELVTTIRSTPFIVLTLVGVLNLVGGSLSIDELYGTRIYPVTHLMIRMIDGSFLLFALIVVTFFAGEMVWRERTIRMHEVFDALPAPTWVYWSSKMTALAASLVVLLSTAMLTTIGVQAARGYTNFELALYGKGLFLDIFPSFLCIAILALFAQIVLTNRYAGFLVMTLLVVSIPVLPALDFEHHLYRFATTPESPYSDMNGYGHFVPGMAWFDAYWGFFAVLLLAVGHLFWVRGTDPGWHGRFSIARARLSISSRAVLGVAFAGFLATGGWIFYNTNVVNRYETTKGREKKQAEYEKLYKKYEGLPQPRIVDVKTDVDIHPIERDLYIRGRYLLRNTTPVAIPALHVVMNRDVKINKLSIPGARETMTDADRGYRIFTLASPMAPGAEIPLDFDLAVITEGFTNDRGNTKIVENGTFFDSSDYFPHLGYSRYNELLDPSRRRKNDLPPVQRMAKVDDAKARMNSYISSEADWLHFETTVSTSADQIALAPGYLQRSWTEGNRRYFKYSMDAPILAFWSYLSARYQVKKDHWNDVAIEVYYDPKHPYNVDRMIDSVKKSLDYFTTHFGPYQHRQVRILEFPRYAQFAQSFPNTIPFSESIGFIANLENDDAIDYVFYVTAHEVAHQWWAHQVIGGAVQGATLMSETLSQYSALMVMEKEYGKEKMQRFLKYELDRYLQGRGGELIEEMPLLLVENQGYIHYRKGSLVMYALRDAIGEEALNRALSAYVRDVKFQMPPYTNSPEFLTYVKRETPAELQPMLADLFETITLYENRATEAKVTQRADGKWVVDLTVEAKKLRSTNKGDEKEVPIRDWIDIGVLAAKPKPADGSKRKGKADELVHLERKLIDKPVMNFQMVVDRKPTKAGIDPQNKLVDRNPEDNVKAVSEPG